MADKGFGFNIRKLTLKYTDQSWIADKVWWASTMGNGRESNTS